MTEGKTAEEPGDEELSHIRERADAIRNDEVTRACSRLRVRGELSSDQRAVIEELANRLVERLLAVPAGSIAAADENEEVAEIARELFDE